STFAGNTAVAGGGIYNFGGTVTIDQSTFLHNSAASSQGVLSNPTSGGGGIFNLAGEVVIHNSTFALNNATPRGGLANVSGGSVTISNSTFAGNLADSPDAGAGLFNGSRSGGLGRMDILGSIMANNTSGNCADYSGGFLTNQGYNLESAADCGFVAMGSR